MRRRITKLSVIVVLFALFTAIPLAARSSDTSEPLRLLTLNLLFSSPTMGRFDVIADYIETQEIDCVLCQEVVGGTLAKELGLTVTRNSAIDLDHLLEDRGLDYRLRYRLANGIPFLFSVGNAIFCRRPIRILFTTSKSLPFASEISVDGIDIKLRRKIMACLLDNVPQFGNLLLFNVHLCAFCPSDQRRAQIDTALEFIRKVRSWVNRIYGAVPCVFGGDFNISEADGSGAESEYRKVTNFGFVDSYAAINGCGFGYCCVPDEHHSFTELGCTFAVDDNPFENDPDQTTRIDYFFITPEEAFNLDMDGSTAFVVFDGNEGDFVSDHSGLFLELKN
jgi:endonuclease/exonuclease/phosphatase family metal-dependent hydrolase